MPEQVIGCREIEVQLSRMLWLELACLQLDHHKGAESQVVEQ
jgi:hypothetical protein